MFKDDGEAIKMTAKQQEHEQGPAFSAGLPLGMPATRKLSADELGLVVLLLLSDAPRYGGELADAIALLSQEFYRPSPGVLYPLLANLTEQGWVRQQRMGRRKYYQVTATGEAFFLEQRQQAEQITQRLQRAGRKLQHIYRALAASNQAEQHVLPIAQELLSARMDLKAAFHESRHLGPAVQHEILAILQDATQLIRQCIASTHLAGE